MGRNPHLHHERQTNAFALLLEPVLAVAYRVAYNLTHHEADAEEMVQEAAILAFKNFDSFKPGTNSKAWFMKILKNCFLMDVRKQKRKPQTVDLSGLPDAFLYGQAMRAGLYSETTNPAQLMLQHVTADELSLAFTQLPEEYRLVAVFYFVEELSYQEIAEYLDIPIGTVRSRLHRGRKMLQKSLWPIAQESGMFSHQESVSR